MSGDKESVAAANIAKLGSPDRVLHNVLVSGISLVQSIRDLAGIHRLRKIYSNRRQTNKFELNLDQLW